MEGNRRKFLNKRSQPQFKRTGGPSKRREHHSSKEESSEKFLSSETVYRILCQSKKIGSVIGRGGDIVKALREETQAKITVSDSVPGSDERVITIFSPSDKVAKIQRSNNSERGYDAMKPHCAAQDALLKVHDRIVEEDLLGVDKRNVDETVVTSRLLVSNNAVGCILGRKGDVIQRLRSETGANIRVLAADHLPACAMSSDELVQISGTVEIAKKALYEISTLLHHNPRKDAPSLHFSTPYASQRFDFPELSTRDEFHPGNAAWFEHSADTHRMQPMPFKGDCGIHPSGFIPEDFDGFTPPPEREAVSEFTMKILCPTDKIGGVIGKGGSTVRHLEQETGASIHVEDASRESYEKVIRVSSFEVLRDQRSQTVDAILYLQDKTSEISDKGILTTRLLVSSSKVGCLLGQGGHIINDMRRRTHADIHVFSKQEKPKCALEDEELVQISGSFGVAKDALVEIASRLRTRSLRDANSRGEPAPVWPDAGCDPTENLHGGFPPVGTARAGSSGRYPHLQGSFWEPQKFPVAPHAIDPRIDTQGSIREPRRFPVAPHITEGRVRDFKPSKFPVPPHPTQGDVCNFEHPSFPGPPRTSSYLDVNEAKIASVSAMGGGHLTEFAGARMGLRDPYIMSSDFGTWEQFASPRSAYPLAAAASPPGSNIYQQPGTYDRYHPQLGAYPNNTASPLPYRSPNFDTPPAYQNVHMQHGSHHQSMRAHGSYRY